MSLLTDVRLALAAAGISMREPDLAGAITRAIADRRGYVALPEVGDEGFVVTQLPLEQMTLHPLTYSVDEFKRDFSTTCWREA